MKKSLKSLHDSIIKKLLESTGKISKASKIYAGQQARWVLEFVLKKSFGQILLDFPHEVQPSVVQRVHRIIKKLALGAPLGYLLKEAPFGPLSLKVNKNVLIPRIETEQWCLWALEKIKEQLEPNPEQPLRILDLCTGSGAIAIFFAKSLENSSTLGVDICWRALVVARANARRNGLKNIRFVRSDLFEKVKFGAEFDIIFSNPPYVGPQEYECLDRSVKDHEPKIALVAQNKGLEFYQRIFVQAKTKLSQKGGLGWLALEFGPKVAKRVFALSQKQGYKTLEVKKDSFGKTRAAIFSL